MPRTPEQFEEIRNKTRQLILEKSLELFAERGYKGTTIADIAKACGISKGLAYNYFDSKLHIVTEIIETLTNFSHQLQEEMERMDDPFSKLEMIITSSVKMIEANENYWKMFMTVFFQPEITEIAKNKMVDFIEEISFYIAELFREIGFKEPEAEARILSAIIDGVYLHYFYTRETYPLERVNEVFLKKYSRKSLEITLKEQRAS